MIGFLALLGREPLSLTFSTMMRRFGFYLCLCVIFFGTVSFLWGCHNDSGLAGKRQKDGAPLLRIAVGRDLYDGPDSRGYVHGSLHVWEGLTYINERLEPKGWLADSWQMEAGGKKWIFQLKEGVIFHDGSLLTQDMVIENILRLRKNPKYDPYGFYQELLSVTAIGKRGIVFQLNQPNPNFPASINYFGSPIFHPDGIDEKGRLVKPIATGPYRFEKNQDGVIHLRAHEAYRQVKPFFQTVEFWHIPDAETRLNALRTGQVDAIVDVGGLLPNQLSGIQTSDRIIVKREPVATTHYLLFNCQRLPFQTLSNRKWMVSTLDRAGLVRFIIGDAGTVADSLMTPLATDWYEKLFPKEASPDKFFPHSFEGEIVILIHSGALQRWPYKEISETLHAHLLQAGLKTKIRIEEAGGFKESLKRGDFDLAIHPFTLMTGEPDIFFSWLGNVSSFAIGFKLKEVSALITKARHEIDRTQRKRIYGQLQNWVSENALLLPLYHDIAFYAHSDSIEGLTIDPLFRPSLMEVKRRDGSR